MLTLLFWLSELAYHLAVDFAPVFLEYIFTQEGAKNPGNSALIFMLILMMVGGVMLFSFGALSDFIGRRKAFYINAMVGILGSILLALSLFVIYNHVMILVSTILLAASFGALGIFGVWSSELYDTDVRSSANGIIFSIARGAGFGGFIVGSISDSLNPYSTTSQRLDHPLISAQAIGVGILLCFFAFIAIIILLKFVPEPKDKIIKPIPTSKILNPGK